MAQKIKAKTKKNKIPPSKKRSGLLIVTNFRLCFIDFDDKNDSKVNFLRMFQVNLLLRSMT